VVEILSSQSATLRLELSVILQTKKQPRRRRPRLRFARLVLLIGVSYSVACQGGVLHRTSAARPEAGLASAFAQLSADSVWVERERIELSFSLHHPEGLVKVGDEFLISSVDVLEWPKKHDGVARDGPDRTLGRGRGYLYRVSAAGELLDQVELGDPQVGIYHPGGMDFDGTHLWVPVAQYRPHSRSIVYRVDPRTLQVESVFSVEDHIGSVVLDRDRGRIYGFSWGSREIYTWDLDGRELARKLNGSHWVDYQDCKYVPPEYMLCSGMKEFRSLGGESFVLGGLALLDVRSQRPVHEIPVVVFAREDPPVLLTRNPMHVELCDSELCFYFAPEDDERGAIQVFVHPTHRG